MSSLTSLRDTIMKYFTADEETRKKKSNLKDKKKADPNMVPLGDGLADRARTRLSMRGRDVDDAVDRMQ